MNPWRMAIFFTIVFAIYGLVNFYIFSRGSHFFNLFPGFKPWFIAIFWFLVSAYLLGRVVERFYISVFSEILTWVGAFWLGAMVYFFLFFLAVDLFRLFFNLFATHNLSHYISPDFRKIAGYSLIIVVCLIQLAGHINAIMPRIRKLEIVVPKNANNLKELNIAMASDIHIGTIIGRNRLKRMVSKINRLQPDVVLFAGDILDEDLAPVLHRNLGYFLAPIKAPHGVYACPGNHEHIGGISKAIDFLEAHGIRVLRDEAMVVEKSYCIAGREDRDAARFSGAHRKPLNKILAGINKEMPVILMDHQPFNLTDTYNAGVDLQLSGHTHHGQVWPFNYITKMIFPISTGYLKNGATHYYVSSGLGTWGPPVRTNSRPEIVFIKIIFLP